MAVKFANNNSLSEITSLPDSITGGAWTLLSTQTASSSSTLSFTSGIDSTYKEYIFKFINIHGASTSDFTFNGSIDGGSNYNVAKTSTYFKAHHNEDDGETDFSYNTSADLAQGTGFQRINGIVNDNDGSGSGTIHLFDPSNTTFVKHFIGVSDAMTTTPYNQNAYIGGYFNTTSAINAVQFKFSSGDIDSGVIKLYGVS